MALDSDINNADSQLYVEFYNYEKDPYKGKPFVRIIVPGDKTTVIDQPVRDDHKERFPRQWLHFQCTTRSSTRGAPGSWPGVTFPSRRTRSFFGRLTFTT